MSPYNNLLILILAMLFCASVVSHEPRHKRHHHSHIAKPPSAIYVPAPSPVVPLEPVLSPVEPPLSSHPSHVISPSISPVVPRVYSPSILTPPVEAPSPQSNAQLNSVSVGLVIICAFLIAMLA
ncbi:hypothetical protein AgCh_001189 [Apium graveolens]